MLRLAGLAVILLFASGCFNHYNGQDGQPPVNFTMDPVMECHLACAKVNHSLPLAENGSCTCRCIMGYLPYNKKCITPEEYEIVSPVLCPADHPVGKHYFWAYRGKEHLLSLCYENLTAPPAENRTARKDYWNFVNDPYSEAPVSTATAMLENLSAQEGYSKYDEVGFAIAFVQGMPYTFDNVSTPFDDYPRYPSETIYTDGGDCEDTAILTAAILRKMGQDVVLLLLPHHLAAGVACKPSDFDYNVSSYPYNGTEYCYLETTGEGWKVGQLPDAHIGENVTVVPMRPPGPDLYMGWGRAKMFNTTYAYDNKYLHANVTGIHVVNFGSMPAQNVRITVAIDADEEGKTRSSYTVEAGDIASRGWYDAYVNGLTSPVGKPFRISVTIHGDNFEPIVSRSTWGSWR